MLQKRFIYLFKVIAGMTFSGRNRHNVPAFWHRALVFIPWYLFSILFAVIDLFFIGYLFTGMMRVSSKCRRLTESELALFAKIPEEQNYLRQLHIIEESWFAKLGRKLGRRKSLGLGIANTVHFCRCVDLTREDDQRWLVHEVAHTIQFKYRGLMYIPEALIAQMFSGYEFGGLKTLEHAKSLRAFNPEQQADIFKVLILSNVKSDLFQEIKEGNW